MHADADIAIEDRDYEHFRRRVFSVLVVAGTVLSLAFVLAGWLGLNDLGPIQTMVTQVFFGICCLILLAIRRPNYRHLPLAILYVAAGYGLFTSALLCVPKDELRVVWFFVEIGGAYIVLGAAAGVLATAGSIATVLVANQLLVTPFSSNATATLIGSLTAASALFYSYTNRSQLLYRQLQQRNAQLQELSIKDPLTGLLNARVFYETCDQQIRVALRTCTPFSVLFIDLDHFKMINDTHGHEAGDGVLKAVAACLKSTCRAADAVGRIGGEEFSMFLPDTDTPNAMVLAERLRQRIEALMPVVAGQPLQVTASIGAARNQPYHHSIAEVQRLADQAMYRAKSLGRNRVMQYDDA